jgi:deoxyadenosine/deoxycytidine kinase
MENETTPKIKHIAIAGNIGAGKTTLSEKLGKHYGWEVNYETADDNPYLSDFYNDMQRWAFNLQIFFLNSRYQQILNILDGKKTVVQDRTIYEDAYIFAPNLHDMGLMTSRDFNNYSSLFHTMNSQIRPPDLLIYLRANISTLVDHIHRRGREYEGNMSLDYLKRLNQRYEDWIGTYEKGRLLIIESDELNFADHPEDLGIIVNKINSELNGLF